jgi:uncharacterized protein DUF3597
MGIFSAILDKLRHHAAPSAPASAPASGGGQQQQQTSQPAQQGAAAQPQLQNVDVDAVLTQLAARKGGGGNYRTSIVDLLKLLDLDSSLEARKELATELNVNAGAPGTAEQNIALHKAVMKKVAENGGKVPDSMKH